MRRPWVICTKIQADADELAHAGKSGKCGPDGFGQHKKPLADDLDPLILEAFKAQRPDVSLAQAFRRAHQTVLARLPAGQLEFANTRGGVAAEAIGHRIGGAAEDFEVRAFAGAVTGAKMAAFDNAPKSAETIYRALGFLDAGMPLG